MLQILRAAVRSILTWNRAFMAGVCWGSQLRAGFMAASSALPRPEDDTPLHIDLYGEAKDTALWIAQKYGVAPGDVVARALGLLYFLVLQEDANRRLVTEDKTGGDRRPITINLKAGDAGTNVQRG
jgi:hypothetical protein